MSQLGIPVDARPAEGRRIKGKRMKRLEIFPLDSCERRVDGRGGEERSKREFFSHGRETMVHLRRSSRARARSTARVGGV